MYGGYIIIYINLTDQQTVEHGAPSFYMMGHYPLQLASKVLGATNDIPYCKKVQLLGKKGDGMAWWGNTLHSLSANRSGRDRLCLYYVLRVGSVKADDSVELRNYPQWNAQHYMQGFEWIREMSVFRKWMERNSCNSSMQSVANQIDPQRLMQFKHFK